jgi:hypothetical protein
MRLLPLPCRPCCQGPCCARCCLGGRPAQAAPHTNGGQARDGRGAAAAALLRLGAAGAVGEADASTPVRWRCSCGPVAGVSVVERQLRRAAPGGCPGPLRGIALHAHAQPASMLSTRVVRIDQEIGRCMLRAASAALVREENAAAAALAAPGEARQGVQIYLSH